MAVVLDILSWAAIAVGGVFCIIGAVGMIRLPDVFSRMHGVGLIDTMGLGMIFLGLALQSGFTLTLAKLGMVLLFVLFTSPTATHALARAARYGGVEPMTAEPADSNKEPERSKT